MDRGKRKVEEPALGEVKKGKRRAERISPILGAVLAAERWENRYMGGAARSAPRPADGQEEPNAYDVKDGAPPPTQVTEGPKAEETLKNKLPLADPQSEVPLVDLKPKVVLPADPQPQVSPTNLKPDASLTEAKPEASFP